LFSVNTDSFCQVQDLSCRTAPQVLRDEGLLQRIKHVEKLKALEDIDVSIKDGGVIYGPEVIESSCKIKYLDELLTFSHELMPRLQQAYEDERVTVVIGGDHAISMASVSAAAQFLKRTQGDEAELGLLWVDAHPDLEMPETSASGNLHGMPVAHLLGYGAPELCQLGGFQPKVKPENLIYIGLRDPSYSERALIKEKNITAFNSSDIEQLGIVEVCDHAFSY
jgi:arginase